MELEFIKQIKHYIFNMFQSPQALPHTHAAFPPQQPYSTQQFSQQNMTSSNQRTMTSPASMTSPVTMTSPVNTHVQQQVPPPPLQQQPPPPLQNPYAPQQLQLNNNTNKSYGGSRGSLDDSSCTSSSPSIHSYKTNNSRNAEQDDRSSQRSTNGTLTMCCVLYLREAITLTFIAHLTRF